MLVELGVSNMGRRIKKDVKSKVLANDITHLGAKYSKDGQYLILTIPVNDVPKVSKTGQSLLIASSCGTRVVDIKFNGYRMRALAYAFIQNPDYVNPKYDERGKFIRTPEAIERKKKMMREKGQRKRDEAKAAKQLRLSNEYDDIV